MHRSFFLRAWLILLAPIAAHADPASGKSRSRSGEPGVDLAGMDTAVAPGDDFFSYANGTWLKQTPIPPDKPAWSAGYELTEQANARTRELLEKSAGAPAGSEARKVADYYATFMDESGIEAKGIAPIKPALTRIAAVKDKEALARALGEGLRADVDPLNATNFYTDRLFGLWVSPNLTNTQEYVPYLLQGGLGMPDRSTS